jgi:hypothetical protein|tara:strand:+ start:144 stop:530 length:387 start_codon:yes stop_codon:yes gene_type:complete
MTAKNKASVEFDYSKYIVSSSTEMVAIEIPETGDSFEVSIMPLSWSKRNQIISKNLNWDSGGNTSFSADGYVRDCLKEMIIEAPWGRTTEAFLMTLDARLGNALETIVPKAFGGEDDGELSVDKIKKE